MSDNDIADLDAKVATLEETLFTAFKELQLVRKQQQVLHRHARQPRHPNAQERTPVTIHSVPVELLIQIFVSAVHGADRTSPQDAQDAFRCAIAISHVCPVWREVALQTSSLWTLITFGRNLRGVRTCLARSKMQALNIVRCPSGKRYPTLPEKNIAMKSHLESTSFRWMSVHWRSSDITMRHVLAELNRIPTFPFLTTLDLVADERRLLGPRFVPFIPDFAGSSIVRFPNLEYLRLTQVPPSDLPPTETRALRSLYLHFPHKQHPEWSHLLRMSNLCAFLYRAPNLEELVIDDSIILMDIRLRPYDEVDHRDESPINPGTRQTRHTISPINMLNLTRFQWDFAPARDLWRFFYFVRMPCLRQLDLLLDRSDERWLQLRGGLVSSIGSIQPISELLTHPVVRFEMLEDLKVECLDTDGLSTAFRKLEFPILKNLSITFVELGRDTVVSNYNKYNRAANAPEIPSQLPRAETIFRDPRMPNLISLELINFHLDGPHTKGMLQYMPALERLSLESCTNASEVVRSLGGITDGRDTTREQWSCTALEHLALKNCHDVGYATLSQIVFQRKHWSRVGDGGHRRAFIPLRKRVAKHAQSPPNSPSGSRHLVTPPRKATANDLVLPVSSLMGSWNTHERKKPSALKTVYVEGCSGFTEAAMEVLGTELEDMVFIP